MSKDVTLSTFPSSRVDALTMLYLQNQDLTGKTPKEIAELYQQTSREVREAFRTIPRPSSVTF